MHYVLRNSILYSIFVGVLLFFTAMQPSNITPQGFGVRTVYKPNANRADVLIPTTHNLRVIYWWFRSQPLVESRKIYLLVTNPPPHQGLDSQITISTISTYEADGALKNNNFNDMVIGGKSENFVIVTQPQDVLKHIKEYIRSLQLPYKWNVLPAKTNDAQYVSTYRGLIALDILKNLSGLESIKIKLNEEFQKLEAAFKRLRYSTGHFTSLSFNDAQKASFIEYLTGKKTLEKIMEIPEGSPPLFPADYTSFTTFFNDDNEYIIDNFISLQHEKDTMKLYIYPTNLSSGREVGISFDINGKRDMAILARRFKYLDTYNWVFAINGAWMQLLGMTLKEFLQWGDGLTYDKTMKKELEIDTTTKISLESVKKAIEQPTSIAKAQEKTIHNYITMYTWILAAHKLMLRLIQFAYLEKIKELRPGTTDYINADDIQKRLDTEIQKYTVDLEKVGVNVFFNKGQENALFEFLKGKRTEQELDLLFKPPQQSSLFKNKYAWLGGGIFAALVIYGLLNYQKKFPELSKYLKLKPLGFKKN